MEKGSHSAAPAIQSKAWAEAFSGQMHVIYALMLHDIKGRFFGNGLGYIVTIIWPSLHIVILVGIYVISGRVPPYGNSAIMFVSTGVLPYIAWNYISRFCQMASLQNKSYMGYPIVKFLDILFARIFLEIISITIITALMLCLLPLFGANSMPNDPQNAALALLSAICLGIGFGVLASVITRIFPLFVLVYVLFLITFWLTCGVAINPEAMPIEIGNILWYNPLLHSVEWMRKAYFIDAPTRLLSKSYVLTVSAVTLTLGLIGERTLGAYFK